MCLVGYVLTNTDLEADDPRLIALQALKILAPLPSPNSSFGDKSAERLGWPRGATSARPIVKRGYLCQKND